MMEKPVAKTLAIVIPAYRRHSQMFNNMLDGIRQADAQTRIDNKTNHFAWIVGNLVNCRYWLAEVLGLPEKIQTNISSKMPKLWTRMPNTHPWMI